MKTQSFKKIQWLRNGIAIGFALLCYADVKATAPCQMLIARIVAQRNTLPAVVRRDWGESSIDNNVPSGAAEEVQSVLHETDQLLAFLKRPPKVRMQLVSRTNNFHVKYKDGWHTLKLGYRAADVTEKGKVVDKHPRLSISSWIHEYSHTYFDENFLISEKDFEKAQLSQIPLYQKLIRQRDTLDKMMDAWDAKGLDLTPREEAEYQRILKVYRPLKEKIWQIEKEQYAKKGKFFQIVAAVSELFCDTVAGVQQGDLDRYFYTLNYAHLTPSERKTYIAPRKYSRKPKKVWPLSKAHDVLHPVRFRIHQLTKNYWPSTNKKTQFLKKFTKVIRNELDSWANNTDLSQVTSKDVNDSFIRALDKEFSR